MLRMIPHPACQVCCSEAALGSANPLWWMRDSSIRTSSSGHAPSALEFRVASNGGSSSVAPRRILPRRIRQWMGWEDEEVDAKKEALLNSRTHEAYRRVVHRLRRVRSGDSGSVVLVVTAVHGEGGSHVAKQLAAALVQAEQGRVLLVDGNLRSPSQHVAFGIQQSPGFVEVAGGPAVETGSLATSDVGFALLPAGQSDDDPIHFMRESIIAGAFDELRKSFDWVVVDGPPVTIYTEAATLSGLADATVLVVRAESTRSEVAERAKKTIAESGGHLAGAILNQRRYHIPDFIYRRL